jgi:hypothetical protein
MSKLKLFKFLLTLLLLFSIPETNFAQGNTGFLKAKDFTPASFLQLFKYRSDYPKFYFVTIETEFPSDWITESQVDSLIRYVKSRDKAYCLVNPLSSYLPIDSAQLGGYAIKLISAYKEKVRPEFGLYDCPMTDDKRADELIQWWSKQKRR